VSEVELMQRSHEQQLQSIKQEATSEIQKLQRNINDLGDQVKSQQEHISKLEGNMKILQAGVRTMNKQENQLRNTISQKDDKINELEQALYALRSHLARANPGNSGHNMWGGSGHGQVF